MNPYTPTLVDVNCHSSSFPCSPYCDDTADSLLNYRLHDAFFHQHPSLAIIRVPLPPATPATAGHHHLVCIPHHAATILTNI